MLDVVIGLGANLGDRLATMREAARRIDAVAKVVARSRVYETAPVGPPQPDYLNAAVLVSTQGPPLSLFDCLLAIERDLGRTRLERWGPRTIDLDVLWIDGLTVDEERLTVPHPRLSLRAFAIAPLLDVAPGAVDPRTGDAYRVPEGQAVRPTPLTL